MRACERCKHLIGEKEISKHFGVCSNCWKELYDEKYSIDGQLRWKIETKLKLLSNRMRETGSEWTFWFEMVEGIMDLLEKLPPEDESMTVEQWRDAMASKAEDIREAMER